MKGLDSRGQVSVEYLLLVLVIILMFTAITIPLVSNSLQASNDVSTASDAKNAVENIAKAVDMVYANGPGAKRTISVYFPQTTTLRASNYTIGLNTTLSNGTKFVNATTQYIVNKNVSITEGWRTVIVYWPVGSSITYNVT
ncbi:class III signal peptide-containing protein [Methanobacterium alcaliphilum]|nr:class III signal peptide-containing protein [Methanobacterium alcaliphilum]